jgi:hypothetical protein
VFPTFTKVYYEEYVKKLNEIGHKSGPKMTFFFEDRGNPAEMSFSKSLNCFVNSVIKVGFLLTF